MKKNEGTLDRMLRAFAAILLWIVAYFWIGGVFSIILYVFGGILLFTSISGFCLLYKPFSFNTLKWRMGSKKWPQITLAVLMIALFAGGTYGSLFFTRKFFLEDYNRMNNYYKQTLFLTGQNQREEALLNYTKLVSEFALFEDKYTHYKPFVIKSDSSFDSDLSQVDRMIVTLENDIKTGDLSLVHKELEGVRPIFQSILKRNGFSMLAVSLVDFHDAMEEILTPANNKDAAGVLAVYPMVDAKLKEVEAIANDEEIRVIRGNLDELYALAQQGMSDELPAKGATLKSSFVKVYLKRG